MMGMGGGSRRHRRQAQSYYAAPPTGPEVLNPATPPTGGFPSVGECLGLESQIKGLIFSMFHVKFIPVRTAVSSIFLDHPLGEPLLVLNLS